MQATIGNNKQMHTHANVEYKQTSKKQQYTKTVRLVVAMKFAVAYWQQTTQVKTLMKMKNLMWHATCVAHQKLYQYEFNIFAA